MAREECMKFLENFGIKISEEDLIKAGYPNLLLRLNH